MTAGKQQDGSCLGMGAGSSWLTGSACRQLLIPLIASERAWSVAMGVKAEIDKSQKHKSYKHLHLVRDARLWSTRALPVSD